LCRSVEHHVRSRCVAASRARPRPTRDPDAFARASARHRRSAATRHSSRPMTDLATATRDIVRARACQHDAHHEELP
jgi:hypothetical protein